MADTACFDWNRGREEKLQSEKAGAKHLCTCTMGICRINSVDVLYSLFYFLMLLNVVQ